MVFLKQNLGKIIFSVIMIGLYFWHSDSFFLVIFLYSMVLYLVIEKIKSRKVFIILSVIIWILFSLVLGAVIYEKYLLPHGPTYPTGLYTCDFNGEGPCDEIYQEDFSNLDIPTWAKFIREHGITLFFGLLFAGILISSNISREKS